MVIIFNGQCHSIGVLLCFSKAYSGRLNGQTDRLDIDVGAVASAVQLLQIKLKNSPIVSDNWMHFRRVLFVFVPPFIIIPI